MSEPGFPEFLQREINRAGLSVDEFSVRIGQAQDNVKRWLNGGSLPSQRAARAITEVLGIPDTVFFNATGRGDWYRPSAKIDRNQSIVNDRKSGMTFKAIGEKHSISTERARQIVKRMRPSDTTSNTLRQQVV